MGTRVVGIDLPESGHFVSDPLLRFPSEHHLKAGELAPNLVVESDFGTRQEETAVLQSPAGAKPRVKVFQNSVVTTRSPSLAGRDATP